MPLKAQYNIVKSKKFDFSHAVHKLPFLYQIPKFDLHKKRKEIRIHVYRVYFHMEMCYVPSYEGSWLVNALTMGQCKDLLIGRICIQTLP